MDALPGRSLPPLGVTSRPRRVPRRRARLAALAVVVLLALAGCAGETGRDLGPPGPVGQRWRDLLVPPGARVVRDFGDQVVVAVAPNPEHAADIEAALAAARRRDGLLPRGVEEVPEGYVESGTSRSWRIRHWQDPASGQGVAFAVLAGATGGSGPPAETWVSITRGP